MIYISDFFLEDINGGAEQNDAELVKIIISKGIGVEKYRSTSVTLKMVEANKNEKYVISNFIGLDRQCFQYIKDNCSYIIYEHDHKYLKTRDPSNYFDFMAPPQDLVNVDFYESAIAVIAQSELHRKIIQLNLPNANVISVGGNIWTEEALSLMESLYSSKKEDVYSIMGSQISHKNTQKTVEWCVSTGKKYSVIEPQSHANFLAALSKNKFLVFNPKTIETLSRIVVEARMLGCSVLTNRDKVGALSEAWVGLSGPALVKEMRKKRETIPQLVVELLK